MLDREKTLNLFMNEEYGFVPEEALKPLTFEVKDEKTIGNVHARCVLMKYKDHAMRLYLYSPANQKKCPTFLFAAHNVVEKRAKELVPDFDYVSNHGAFINHVPVDYILLRGCAVGVVIENDIVLDTTSKERYATLESIITKITPNKKDNEWGVISAWAWGLSKAMDFISTLPEEFDLNNVATIGHSRGGKTALLAAARDDRFVMGVSSCSGNSGAAISRNKTGERIKDIIEVVPQWFCKNYEKYVDNEDNLPFDQHQLIGCIAPRLAYVFSASADDWACPKNELLACRMASEYYEDYGLKGLVAPEEIENDKSYGEGHIAYHVKTGTHCIELKDWVMVINFFKDHLR